MWGPISKSDERYYKRKAAEDKARAERRKRQQADMPRRLAIIARVKAGEITLSESKERIYKTNAEREDGR